MELLTRTTFAHNQDGEVHSIKRVTILERHSTPYKTLYLCLFCSGQSQLIPCSLLDRSEDYTSSLFEDQPKFSHFDKVAIYKKTIGYVCTTIQTVDGYEYEVRLLNGSKSRFDECELEPTAD